MQKGNSVHELPTMQGASTQSHLYVFITRIRDHKITWQQFYRRAKAPLQAP